MKDLWGLKDLTIHDVALLHVQEHVVVLGLGLGFRIERDNLQNGRLRMLLFTHISHLAH